MTAARIAEVSETATLPGGRKLGFARWGARDGHTVFYLHGAQSSRVEGGFFDQPALKLGANIVSIDRPGMGLSSPQPFRTVSDHAKDVGQLAECLGCHEYSIIGTSGGAPFALACARFHDSERLKAVALVAGLGPPSLGSKGMGFVNKLFFFGYCYAPSLVRLVTVPIWKSQLRLTDDKFLEATQKRLQSPFMGLPNKDKEVLAVPGVTETFIASTREHFRQGFDASIQDGTLFGSDWDFKMQDITFRPIKLWYGKQDVNVPARMGEEIKRMLGDRAEFHLEDETHISLVFNYREKILADLLGSV